MTPSLLVDKELILPPKNILFPQGSLFTIDALLENGTEIC
jgi:hypothetical protein